MGWCGNLHCYQVWGRQVSSSHPNPSSTTCTAVAEEKGASAPSLLQQDPLITSLCCTLVKDVYSFSFFQAEPFLPVICWGQSFPPTLKLCSIASVEKNNILFLLFSSPKHGFLFLLHLLFLYKASQAVGTGNGQRCVLWVRVERQDLKTKTGQSPESQATEADAVLSRCGLYVIWQQKHTQSKGLEPNLGGVRNPVAGATNSLHTFSLGGKPVLPALNGGNSVRQGPAFPAP